ncbi:hypothetical protein F383_39247 [Gossypium arboreum]|uniref:Uncharacterized protein n=1 Tax=Gossypium arboreum TaxID=29729 RepID=A0A0B0MR13_GOSAR|nr:hypothetical protein F383_39247 [Gossypium arboreum]
MCKTMVERYHGSMI